MTQFSRQAAPMCQYAYGLASGWHKLALPQAGGGVGGWLLIPRLPPGARVGR